MIVRAPLFLATTILIQAAQAAPSDPRVRLLPYEPDRVADLAIDFGYAAVVELLPDETIDTIVVGNSAGWQVTPSSSNDRIVVKPLAGAAVTDMIVITDARRYVFLLQPGGGPQGLFVLRLIDPENSSAGSTRSAPIATYKLSGTRSLFPKAMRDDGTRTRITWADQAALPAIFARGPDGKEAIVNGRMVGKDYVIEGTSPTYILRLGTARAVASRKPVKAPR